MARTLLYHGADIDYISTRGWNTVHHIWHNPCGGARSAELLDISSSANFDTWDVQDGAGWSCLHRAAAYGKAADIRTLIQSGAPTSLHTMKYAWSPLQVAAIMNNVSTLEALLDHWGPQGLHSPDSNGWTPLHLAVERQAKDTMKFLLKRGADPHLQTFDTATRFPEGLENQLFRPVDLARYRGPQSLIEYTLALQDAGWSVVLVGNNDNIDDDNDMYWDAEEDLCQPLLRTRSDASWVVFE